MSSVGSLALIVVLVAEHGSLIVQGTDLGTIRGAVSDPSGARVGFAQIKLSDLTTNIGRTIVADANGDYEISGLKPGSYSLLVSKAGFANLEVPQIFLHNAEAVRADLRLQVAGSNEAVTISSRATTIGTESAVVSNTLDDRALTELPRHSRDIYSFLYLSPNITQARQDTFKFIGAQSYGASFTVDGLRTTGSLFGGPTLSQPTLESVGELTVLSDNFTAEYSGIASVRIVTKRGGDKFHGSLFHRNKKLGMCLTHVATRACGLAFLSLQGIRPTIWSWVEGSTTTAC